MSIQITHFPDINDMVTVLQPGAQGSVAMVFNHGEQRELLEALAKAQGFTLVDRVERRELQSLVKEADEARYENEELSALSALATAVNALFDVREQAPIPDIPVTQSHIIPKEV